MKQAEFIKSLRKNGLSYKQIQNKTGINTGTISYTLNPKVREQRRQYRNNRRRNFKNECVAYKGGKCKNCGFDKYIAALDFHHTDPKAKENNIAHSFDGKGGLEAIKEELNKCILLCSNCHRGLHSGELKFETIASV